MSKIKRIRFFCSALNLLSVYDLADGSVETAVDSVVTEDGQLMSFEGPSLRRLIYGPARERNLGTVVLVFS
jgi:hypothetical protein